MLISAVQQFTMIDYPGAVACIVFTAGCNFRCGYCHNPEFVLPESIQKLKSSFIPEGKFFNFLNKRKGFLDGVVISGGEPTIMKDLPDFIKKIRSLGFKVKLDSNGNNPEALKNLFYEGLLDYIAMDVKTSADKYNELVGPAARKENILESISLIKNCGIEYEFRSTLVKELHTEDVLKDMAVLVEGAKNLYLQKFRPEQTLNPAFRRYNSFSDAEMEKIATDIFAPCVENVCVR